MNKWMKNNSLTDRHTILARKRFKEAQSTGWRLPVDRSSYRLPPTRELPPAAPRQHREFNETISSWNARVKKSACAIMQVCAFPLVGSSWVGSSWTWTWRSIRLSSASQNTTPAQRLFLSSTTQRKTNWSSIRGEGWDPNQAKTYRGRNLFFLFMCTVSNGYQDPYWCIP